MSDEGCIEPLWSKGLVLPTYLVDILNCADIDSEIEDIEKTDVDQDSTSDEENDVYRQAEKQ